MLLNTITLKEAQASSEIENIITTQDELYRAGAVKAEDSSPAAKEVLRYRSAMVTGVRLLRKKNLITTNDIIAVQQEIELNSAGQRGDDTSAAGKPGELLEHGESNRSIGEDGGRPLPV